MSRRGSTTLSETVKCLFTALSVVALAGCASAEARKPPSTAKEASAPEGRGVKRAFVLVDEAKKPDVARDRVEDQYSSKRIVEKVTAP